jgi:hypothetical protein
MRNKNRRRFYSKTCDFSHTNEMERSLHEYVNEYGYSFGVNKRIVDTDDMIQNPRHFNYKENIKDK